ncbi:MAG TPA: hypothetical protein VF576_12190 [Rubricoccaceae bacterium]
MRRLPALALRSGLALLLAPLSASAQTAATGRPAAFVELRAGEEFFEHVGNGPGVEPLLYLWLAAFEQAREAAAALDSVAAASPPPEPGPGPVGWSDAQRAVFRRGLVRTAVAAAAGRAHVEFAAPLTVALAPEADRDRVVALLDRRAEWLRDRLAGTATFTAAAASCPDATAAEFRACLALEGEVLEGEEIPWRDVRDDIDGALRILDRLMFSEGAPAGAPSGGLFVGLWDDPRAVAAYYLWADVFDEVDGVTEGLGFAAGAVSPSPDEVRYGLGSAAAAASTATEGLAEAVRVTAHLADRRTAEGTGFDVPPARLVDDLEDVLRRTAALASEAAACLDAGTCTSPPAPAVWAGLLADVLADAGALDTALTGPGSP